MGRYVAVVGALVVFLEVGLHRRDVADDAVCGEVRQYLLEGGYGIFHGDGVDDEFGGKIPYLVESRQTLAVVSEAHSFWVFLIHCRFVVEAEQVEKETAHLSCA